MSIIQSEVIARALGLMRKHTDNPVKRSGLDGAINTIAAVIAMGDRSFDHVQFKRDCGLSISVDCAN